MRAGITLAGAILLALLGWASSSAAEGFKTDTPEAEIAVWRAIEDSREARDFEAYLEAFPNGLLRELAINRLTVLKPGTPPHALGELIALSDVYPKVDRQQLEIAFWDCIRDSVDPRDYSA